MAILVASVHSVCRRLVGAAPPGAPRVAGGSLPEYLVHRGPREGPIVTTLDNARNIYAKSGPYDLALGERAALEVIGGRE